MLGRKLSQTQRLAQSPQPFVKWAGGKRQLLDELSDRLPSSFNRYYEPFVGGGALFFNLQTHAACINDLNTALVNTYRKIQSDVEALVYEIDLIDTAHAKANDPKEYYYRMRALYNEALETSCYDIKTAALFIYLNKHCFNGLYRVNARGMFNVPFNKSIKPSYTPENLSRVAKTLQNVSILNENFESACNSAGKGDLVFFDSPYAPLKDGSFKSYTKQGFAREDHVRLSKVFERLTKKGCKCILTNHNTELIQELYKDYLIEVVSVRRSINSDATKRKGTEVIIRNYE